MKQKRTLIRILITAAAFAAAWLLPLEGIAQLLVYLAVYALIGWGRAVAGGAQYRPRSGFR